MDKWKEIKGKLSSINKKKKIAVSGIAVLLIAVLAIGGTWGCQKADQGNTVKAESVSTIKKVTASGTGSTDSDDETEEKSKDTETDSEEKRTEEKKTSTSSDSEEKKTAANTSSSPKATSGSSNASGATSTSGNSGSSGNTGSSGSSGSSSSSGTSGSGSSSHTHNWKPVYTTVHHNAVYETRTVVDSPAWDETVSEPVYEMKEICVGNQSGIIISGDPNEYLMNNNNGDTGWHSEWQQVQTGTNTYTVHHDAVTHTEQVKVKDAWDEQVLSGYRCSCGATK